MEPVRASAFVPALVAAPLPVLRGTVLALARARQDPERASAQGLAQAVLQDPMMCVRVLGSCADFAGSLRTPVETVTGAILLMGMDRFLAAAEAVPCIEDHLAPRPVALRAALQVVERSWCAARLAAAFAIHRQDDDAELAQQAALVGAAAEIAAWCASPLAMLEVAYRLRADPQLRSAHAQLQVLGVDLERIRGEWLDARGVPESVRSLLDPAHAAGPASHGVQLALRLARHLQHGWHDAALPDDFAETGALLHISPSAAAQLARQVLA